MIHHRIMSIAVVLSVTAGSYAVFNSDLFFLIVDEIGLFLYYSLTPLTSIILLYKIPGTLSRNLTVLFGILVFICLILWLLTGFGNDVIDEFLLIQDVAFAVEILLMMPRGLINGFIGALRRLAHSRAFESAEHSAYNRINRLQADDR